MSKATSKPAPMTGAEYMQNPHRCPYCRVPTAQGAGICSCAECGGRWRRVYRRDAHGRIALVGYDPHPPALRPAEAAPAPALMVPMASGLPVTAATSTPSA